VNTARGMPVALPVGHVNGGAPPYTEYLGRQLIAALEMAA
jgi:hypothetical protein